IASSDLSFEIDELRRSLAASFLVVSALAIVLSVLLARQLTAPARRLAAAARRLAAGDREARVGPAPADEIGAAAAAFDAMAERVHELELERRALMRTVSHDIHSLIAGMRAGVEALDRGAGQDPELGPTLLRGLTSHTARLQRLVDDLLESARLESGGLELSRRPLVPEALLEQARAELAADLADRRIALVVECEAGLPALDADADRLLQVIGNLVDNSLRYTPPGGQIELRAYRTGSGVGLRLADTGSGFAVEELDGADGVAGPGGRFGLGLRIARGLVEAHGGRFAIASTPGAGTTVTIELPIEAESTPPPSADDGAPEPRRDATEPARAPLAKRQDRRYRRPVRAG
ncbi:MAG: HAMP domain-containing histidine kinase, partial [Chloroflexi bacterium]|nr:HAMP domain-containing histidine kinase [Chloroflexota bacterium]